ncbi:hypothetical protein [Polynucleobacter sp. CS-Odin-A6]|nr:hypothetical protein [Polynucleobacter sp. CS-Odin-A6]MBU3621998.1 hypothetical protein [Polynucleobacter sp. CS-Odin-A6]
MALVQGCYAAANFCNTQELVEEVLPGTKNVPNWPFSATQPPPITQIERP